MIFKKGELFCGPGGLSWGANEAIVEKDGEIFKVEHEWANDYHAETCETFIHNICPHSPETVLCGDVRELEIEKLPPIDAFAFGFPCNDFSIVGESKGLEGTFGPLYSFGIKVLKYHQPKWFMAENVGGLESANGGQAFQQILKEMEEAGYVITPHLYKFQEYGVPQSRHRIIIVGIRKDLGLKFKVPKPTTIENKVTAQMALENPPILENALNHELTRHNSKVIEMLKAIPPGENAWYEGIPEHLRLNVKGAKLSNIYKRLDPIQPSYTVTGSGGGGTHMYHYYEPRALTNRERARLQTFPDNFEFIGGKESVRRQIGMAVPPLGVKVIVEAILKTFAGISYEYVSSKWDDEFKSTKVKVKRKGKVNSKKSNTFINSEQTELEL